MNADFLWGELDKICMCMCVCVGGGGGGGGGGAGGGGEEQLKHIWWFGIQ